jgi:formyltetrahydrofolate deformylase
MIKAPIMAEKTKKTAHVKVSGPDQRGIITTVTKVLFDHQCNIEDIDQRVLDDTLIMNMEVDYSLCKNQSNLTKTLKKAGKSFGMEVDLHPHDQKLIKNVALLVTKESHCLIDLLKKLKTKAFKGECKVIIGNHPDLEPIAKEYKIPFYHISAVKKKEHERKALEILKKFDIDLIVLARYMQILSPEFVFRYEGQIINIHPSLLPAFPGPKSYHQAFNKGVEFAGVTAHFVTTDLDEGPIITQECFPIDKNKDTIEKIIKNGQKCEVKALTRAVKLYLEDRLYLRRGKVLDNQHLSKLKKKTKSFYR